jgi:hypothetical protein
VPSTEIDTDVSFERKPNGMKSFSFFYTPTPLASYASSDNNELIKPPVFSNNVDLHSSSFDLVLSSTSGYAIIIYTTDGLE